MVRVVDGECWLPPDENGVSRRFPEPRPRAGGEGPERLPPPEDYGFSNYQRIFVRKPESQNAYSSGISLSDFDARLEADGIEHAVLIDSPNATVASILKAFPDRFIGLAALSPHDGMRAVRELERLVREEGFSGLYAAPLRSELPASDRRYYPLYAKCVELDIPVRIYTSMSYATDRAYDLGHPRYLDAVAVDFPELRILAGLSGWPWVNDMVALLRRHPNLYCDTSSHRPRHFATPGAGWEMFLQFGNSLLQDKVMVGLATAWMGLSNQQLIDEYLDLPLKDAVKEKWLYRNAKTFFRLS
jgi:uncharacterized protein